MDSCKFGALSGSAQYQEMFGLGFISDAFRIQQILKGFIKGIMAFY